LLESVKTLKRSPQSGDKNNNLTEK